MLFLGVDGGGSKTAALLVNERGEVVGSGMGGGANYHILGLAHTVASVKQAVEAALNGQTPDAACFCMTAADTPHDFEQLRQAFQELGLTCPLVIYNDAIGIFRAGSRFPYGAVVICGTGFNAGGISRSGVEFRLPALGAITGDVGGGGYLGLQALGVAFRAWDGRGEPTSLSAAVLETFKAADFEALAEKIVKGEVDDSQINSLAPLVFEASVQGDAVATRLIREQGIELGTSANAMLRRLDLLQVDCDVVLGGGAAYGVGSLLLDTMKATIAAVAPLAHVQRLDVPPVLGAVLLALDFLKLSVTADFTRVLRATLPPVLNIHESE